jgi:hypothetical protein
VPAIAALSAFIVNSGAGYDKRQDRIAPCYPVRCSTARGVLRGSYAACFMCFARSPARLPELMLASQPVHTSTFRTGRRSPSTPVLPMCLSGACAARWLTNAFMATGEPDYNIHTLMPVAGTFLSRSRIPYLRCQCRVYRAIGTGVLPDVDEPGYRTGRVLARNQRGDLR